MDYIIIFYTLQSFKPSKDRYKHMDYIIIFYTLQSFKPSKDRYKFIR